MAWLVSLIDTGLGADALVDFRRPTLSMRNMNFRWITLFATIAEEGSFTRAATKLNIAQPWLSAQIRKLEYELGVQLLVRESVGVKVTEAGQRLLPHAQQMAESARMFREIARSLDESQSRVVMLGSYLPLIDLPQFKKLTIDFTAKYAEYELHVSNDGAGAVLKALESSSIDLAVVPGSYVEDAEHIRTLPLGTAQVCLVSPIDNPVGSLNDRHLKLIELPPRDWDANLFAKLSAQLEQAGIASREVAEFDQRAITHAVRTRGTVAIMVLDDGGIAELSESVHVVRLDGPQVNYLLCRMSERNLGRAAERFWKTCASAAAAKQN